MSWSLSTKMDINFTLNDRQNSNQLSDQIISSAEEIFQAFLSNDLIQKFLMKGEMNDNNIEIAHRRLKDILDDKEWMLQMIANLKQLTESSEEKQFFDVCITGIEKLYIEVSNKYEKAFGKMEAKVANSPMTQWSYSYQFFALYNSSKGTYLGGLALLLGIFMFGERILDYLKQNPNYSPNIFANLLLFEDFGSKQICERIRQMIDSREDQVLEEERKQMSELFKRTLAYEWLPLKHNFTKGDWYQG